MFVIFYQAVLHEPDAIAFILSNKESLTYGKANEIIDLWAKYLFSVGVRQGDRVAVLSETEDLHPFLHLAIDKLNATVVPLDTEIPLSQLDIDIKHLDLQKIVIDKERCSQLQIPAAMQLQLTSSAIRPPDWAKLASLCLPQVERNSAIPNYIVASSGVSGNKKWIPIQSAGLYYWAEVEKKLLNLSNKDKILCTRSPAYDARISEYLRSFAAGGTLVLLSQTNRRDFAAILHECEQEKITCLILIASQLTMSKQEEIIQGFANAGLIHLMVTGDACTMGLKQLCEKYQINLWNCYGPTEATFGMSILCVNHEEIKDEQGNAIVPIGLPFGDEVKFHLIDECLYIESPYLSTGYFNNPEMTKKNFPSLSIDGRLLRVFNTENKFSFKDNRLIFKGRINPDAHCKVSGVKIEPYAIQQCLEKYNQELGQEVFQVYVVVKDWLASNKPFAYLVIQQAFNKAHFMGFLKKWLRKEEMPIVIALPEFPRLIPSEKIDSRALIARVDHSDEFFFNDFVATPVIKDEKHSILSSLWCKILGLSNSNDEQEFMFLGGDSLKLRELLDGIQTKIDTSYTLQNLINLPSITFANIYNSLAVKQQENQNLALIKPLFQPNSSNINYFFLPPLLGEGYFTYRELSKIFFSHHQFNIYGLSDPSIYDANLLPKSLEDAASRYVRTIQTIQPNGPYHLLGFSFGGTLAYYVAKELLAQGKKIKALHLVDGFPPAMYQQLPANAHAALLEELINFIIQTLNLPFYDEKLKPIKLTKFEKFTPGKQVLAAFDWLTNKVKKSQSKSLLAISRQHLLFMLEKKETTKLPVWANLYLSTPNQTYLDSIYRIPKIVKKSTHCQYYYWNKYFQEINLASQRVTTKHLGLLKPQNMGNSAYIFWENAHDPLLNLSFDYFGPDAYYYLEKRDESKSACFVYSLGFEQLSYYKSKLLQESHCTNLKTFPLYERIFEKYKPKDRIYVSKYGLFFDIANEKIETLKTALSKGDIKQYSPQTAKKIHLTYIKNKENLAQFFINLDIYWNRFYLMSLYFNCHANSRQIVKGIFDELAMSTDNSSEPTNSFYNYSYCIYLEDCSIFAVIRQISLWLNQFILLLLPHILPSEERSPESSIASPTA
jgi:thioesterase domain-containing protein/acyl-coenzyme A synthetase/AMP-(fatty) acid ligase